MRQALAIRRVVSGRRSSGLLLLAAACAATACLLAVLLLLVATRQRSRPAVVAAAAGLAVSVVVALTAGRRVARALTGLERRGDALCGELLRVAKPASLGEIAFSIAHDLNNPLAIINEEAGWLRDLLGESRLDNEFARREFAGSLSQIASQVKRGSEITGRVLEWAREQDRRGDAEGVDVNEVLTATLHLLEPDLARTANVRVVKRLEAELPRTGGSSSDIGQVFLHLTKNALDAMKDTGGTLAVSTERAGTTIRVQVSDTGPGIASGVRESIFEPFFTTKASGEGTGLGLAISAWIVRHAGGRIEVDTKPGSGATFRVVLPIRAAGERGGGSHAGGTTAVGR